MDKKFGDIKVGDCIYKIIGLDVKELKITKIKKDKDSFSKSVTLYFDPIPEIKDSCPWVYVGIHFSSSYNSSLFVSKEEAWKRLIKNSKARYKELTTEIDVLITEFDKLDEFLDEIKGKTPW